MRNRIVKAVFEDGFELSLGYIKSLEDFDIPKGHEWERIRYLNYIRQFYEFDFEVLRGLQSEFIGIYANEYLGLTDEEIFE